MTTTENQITVSVTGKNRVDLVKHLRAFADNLDGSPLEETTRTTKKTATATDIDTDDDFDTDTTKTTKATKTTGTKKAAASFDEDEETEVEETEELADDEDDFTTPPAATKKTAKAKKITSADLNDACKARAKAGGKKGRAEVLAILKKKFKTESVSEIEEKDYAAVIKAMAI